VQKNTHKTPTGTPANAGRPELQKLPTTFRLPRVGQRDPHFGLSRSWYYSAEARGDLTLIRLRERGKMRGATLIPAAEVLNLITSEMK
jgi:hypothetical protein